MSGRWAGACRRVDWIGGGQRGRPARTRASRRGRPASPRRCPTPPDHRIVGSRRGAVSQSARPRAPARKQQRGRPQRCSQPRHGSQAAASSSLGARLSNEFTRWDERRSLGRRVRRLWAQCPAFASLRRLWAVQIIAHSPRTRSRPRSRNYRKPLACLICPNTGSTTCFLRRWRLRRPARFRRTAIALINGIFVSLRRPAASASP